MEVFIWKKNGKIISTFRVVAIVLIVLFVIYILFFWKNPNIEMVEAFSNDLDYSVYSGKNVYEWWRGTLSEKEQILYDEMKESFLQFDENFYTKLVIATTDRVDNAYSALLLDHPEIFWIDSYDMPTIANSKIIRTNCKIEIKYSYTKDEAIEIKNKIEPVYMEIINGAKKQENDYKKIKYVHDKLINLATYTKYNKDNVHEFQSIVSIFDTKESVCAGYTYGFKFIMDQLDIDSIATRDVGNEVASDNHIWNMVNLYGTWYNIDVTYDGQLTKNDIISYNYFLKSNSEFYKDHEMQKNIPQN